MKRIILSAFLAFAVAISGMAQSQAKPKLKYKADGTFKILQLTDIHYKYGKGGSKRALECIESVLESEKPDFVIITGDLVYGDGVENAITEMTEPIIRRSIPFSITFGNHDHQFDRTLSQTYDQVQKEPLCVMPERGDVESPDYTVELYSSDGAKVANVFYCMDTHSGYKTRAISRYRWINHDQINWYVDNSRQYREENGGEPVPSLLFIHIPLMEYRSAEADKKCPMIGTMGEGIASPDQNSGMFTAMLDEGDIYGVFCGHDHDNDYATAYFDVLLAYGRYSGGDTVYNHLRPSGARIIELKENSPRQLRTWLRLADGSVLYDTQFPDDYKRK